MGEFIDGIEEILDRFEPIDALDIFLIALIIYGAFMLLRGTAAIALLRGAAIILVAVVALAQVLNLQVLDFAIRNSFTGLLIAVPIIFHPEIRRALERVGRTGFRVWARASYDGLIDTVSDSAKELSRQRHGALIVFERETGLQDYIDTGVPVDATPTAELLEGIFFPNAPLHDGAVILRDNRVVAAGCTLPMAQTRLSGEMGMRHQAGLGVTEETDAVSLMVSEETGMVAVAADGRVYTRLDDARLRGLLARLLGSANREDGARASE
ncbi:MAG: diadenylate cyclase CdaA [Dehalococcoidia bacterium]|nr:diadenylate cyclase CdaA [Dehalococcoidia bacterium]